MTRVLGAVFLAAGLVLLCVDLAESWATGPRLRALGEWWARLDRESLQLAQPAIERHVAPFLWDPVILNLLLAPAAALLSGLGVVLLALSFRRRRR